MKNVAGLLLAVLVVGCEIQGIAAEGSLVNFGKVNDSLYRGGQPYAAGMKLLQEMGVKSVINLRMTNDQWQAEAAVAASCSMTYTNFPLNSLAAPTDAQVAGILAAIESLPKPVFIHCQYGCDRTGTIIACYRIQHDNWPNAKAFKEAQSFGISPYELEMRRYIARFNR
jgi:tyrosine-protein phosphatase SIW14